MNPLRSVRMILAAAGLLAVVGCAPSKEEMESMMRQPPRPPALNQLDFFVGSWTSTARVKMCGSDEVKDSAGKNSTQWDLDKRVLVERWEYEMDSKDNIKKGISLMWYDTSDRKFRMTSADDYGGRSRGSMTYDEQLGKWKMRGSEIDKNGHRMVLKGTCTKVDDRTMQWEISGYKPIMGLNLIKIMEISGTSKKQ